MNLRAGLLAAALALAMGAFTPVVEAQTSSANTAYGKLPIFFVANRGQSNDDARFLLHGPQGTAGFREDSVAIRCPSKGASLSIQFVEPDPDSRLTGVGRLAGRVNYLVGGDASQWRRNVPTYSGVRYRDIWPGIDVLYRGEGPSLKYDVIISPGADPNRVRLRYRGADSVTLSGSGDLITRVAEFTFTEQRPVIYQEVEGRRVVCDGRFHLDGDAVGFEIEDYDCSLPLIIDPVSDLVWSTLLGGAEDDVAYGVAVDSTGCSYVVGHTRSADFPTVDGFCEVSTGNDAFVAKLNASGNALVYGTFLGGSADDGAFGVAVDSAGCAYLAGYTASADFPAPLGYDTTYNGETDAFVTKLSANGSSIVYSTFLGGIYDPDQARAIAVDSSGCAYVTGSTSSEDFPVTIGAFDTTYNDNGEGHSDAFVTKLAANGLSLVYSTFLGGSLGTEEGLSIVVDPGGNCYVAGSTMSSDFPSGSAGYDTGHNGGADGFVVKLNPSGTAPLVYSTYLGGSGSDNIYGLALDSANCAYVVGSTYAVMSPYYPTTGSAFRTTPYGSFDAFVTKLNAIGASLTYSTFLGGAQFDTAYAVAVDFAGCAHVTGATMSTAFPTTPDGFMRSLAGNMEVFLTKMNSAGSLPIFSTLLGESGSDKGYAVALDLLGPSYGGVLLAGETGEPGVPATPGAYSETYAGGLSDAFAAKMILPASHSIAIAKLHANGRRVEINGEVITAAFANDFYIESADRSAGLKVVKTSHGLAAGTKVNVYGTMQTDGNGERYVSNPTITSAGSGSIDPVFVRCGNMGGGPFLDPVTGAGQQGVSGGVGLNNIGLLITTMGIVTQVGQGYLYVDNGSGIRDGTLTGGQQNVGVRVICDASGYQLNDRIQVKGISSCFKETSGAPMLRRILTRDASDVVLLVRP